MPVRVELSLKGRNVLLVEDDFLILLDLKLVLEGAGASVVTATSVAQGLSLVDQEYHAAILDIRLPDGEVFPVADALMEKKTPVIFHSANTEHSALDDRFPAAVALQKPTLEEDLLDIVRQQTELNSSRLARRQNG